ncbi:hypothetical protein A3Q56_06518 [Intoshia linei]|uniref:VPS10 domain-containing protein n=1 Tax=Intoshia linei TaxID=1819745 RepID=A0A177AWL5_9BILA|nr:hypothetical protein A3Q56_06518 [Intoshia linei]
MMIHFILILNLCIIEKSLILNPKNITLKQWSNGPKNTHFVVGNKYIIQNHDTITIYKYTTNFEKIDQYEYETVERKYHDNYCIFKIFIKHQFKTLIIIHDTKKKIEIMVLGRKDIFDFLRVNTNYILQSSGEIIFEIENDAVKTIDIPKTLDIHISYQTKGVYLKGFEYIYFYRKDNGEISKLEKYTKIVFNESIIYYKNIQHYMLEAFKPIEIKIVNEKPQNYDFSIIKILQLRNRVLLTMKLSSSVSSLLIKTASNSPLSAGLIESNCVYKNAKQYYTINSLKNKIEEAWIAIDQKTKKEKSWKSFFKQIYVIQLYKSSHRYYEITRVDYPTINEDIKWYTAIHEFYTITILSSIFKNYISYDNGDSFESFLGNAKQNITHFAFSYKMGITIIQISNIETPFHGTYFVNYGVKKWVQIMSENIHSIYIKNENTEYIIIYMHDTLNMWLSFDGARSWHKLKTSIQFSYKDEFIIKETMSNNQMLSLVFLNTKNFTISTINFGEIDKCKLNDTSNIGVTRDDRLLLFQKVKTKIPCQVDPKDLQIKRNLYVQCTDLDFMCQLGYTKINNLCFNPKNLEFKNVCFNSKMQNIQMGYIKLFNESFYEKYCFSNLSENITFSCENIQIQLKKYAAKYVSIGSLKIEISQMVSVKALLVICCFFLIISLVILAITKRQAIMTVTHYIFANFFENVVLKLITSVAI